MDVNKLKNFSISEYDNLSEIKYLIESRSCLYQTCRLMYEFYFYFRFLSRCLAYDSAMEEE